MKNKKVIIITVTSLTVLGILYLAIKKSGKKDFSSAQLEADYKMLIKKIENTKT